MNALVRFLGAANFMDTFVGKPDLENNDTKCNLIPNGNGTHPMHTDRLEVTAKKDN